MRYEHTKELETGNALIDKEHREPLNAVNDMLDACGKGQGSSSVQKTGRIPFKLCKNAFRSRGAASAKKAAIPTISSTRRFTISTETSLTRWWRKYPIREQA